MKRGFTFTATLAVAAALAAGAAGAGGQEAGTSAGPAGTRADTHRCSASSLPAGRSVRGLPRAVASMRLRIIAAARRCDYALLERLGNERGRGLTFSYGAGRSAARFWRTLERSGEKPPPMAALVKVLAMPFARNEARFYVWPSAHRENPTERDWRALRTLYTAAQIERMKRGGTGYLGYRVGITAGGDWQYFVAGD